MLSKLRTIALVTLLFVVTSQSIGAQISDQQGTGWSKGQDLIADDAPDGHLPRLVADQQGRLHAFWVSWLGSNAEKSSPGDNNSIMYRRLDGDAWTQANDILTTQPAGPLILGDVAIDDRGYLNVLWFDQGNSRRLFLSQSHVSLADRASSWNTMTLESPSVAMGSPHMAVENSGRMHVVYPLDNKDIVYIASHDYGVSWSTPVVIGGVNNSQTEAVSNPRIVVDAKGFLHVVWTQNTEDFDWAGEKVFYARSVDDGLSWQPREVQSIEAGDPTVGWINVAVRKGDEIHLAWNRGIGSRLGRYHSWSPDNGDTWLEPEPFLPDFISGQTQWPLMVVDSANVLHLITVAGGQDGITAPRYASWDGENWSALTTFPESTGDLDVAFTIGLGNHLHLVHANERFGGRLLYNSMITSAPALAPQNIPTPPPVAPVATIAPTDIASRTEPSVQPNLVDIDRTPPPSTLEGSTVFQIALAAAMALLIIVPSVIWQTSRRRSR